mgnify:CR=1 FL=1
MLFKEFDNELEVYKFLNRISKDKLVRVIAILPKSGYKEGKFELFYKFVDEN